MRAQVFINQTEGGFVEVSVVKLGLSSGAGHKYDAGKAKAVLLAFGFDAGLVDRQGGGRRAAGGHLTVSPSCPVSRGIPTM